VGTDEGLCCPADDFGEPFPFEAGGKPMLPLEYLAAAIVIG